MSLPITDELWPNQPAQAFPASFPVEGNVIPTMHSTHLCIHQLFEAQAQRTPEATAVICENQELTYRELNMRANQFAHYLRTLGVGPEIPVGLCMERSLDVIVTLFGILKAGGVYVPIDPDYPPERLAFLLEDSQAPILVTQKHLRSKLPTPPSQLVCLDTDWQKISQQSAENPVSGVRGEHLAYIIYTSGSTGKPKGVLIEHHALAAHCLAVIDVYGLTAEDGALAFSTFSFDASLEQLLPPLLAGARVVVRGQEMWTPADVLRQIKTHQLTIASMPVAYWHQVISEWALDPQQLTGHPLRLLVAGGERFPLELAQLWQQTPLRSARFFNVYGPTEATITATYFDIPRDSTREQLGESVPIGRPFPNHTIYILDEASHPVPVGVAGELHIGGDVLARGYLNRPDLTTERFIPNLFSPQQHARLYKTGDLVRSRPDGIIEFLGRVDQQVKIRGLRIELGEIETVLSQHTAVNQAAVIVHKNQAGEDYLVAYVVLHKGQATTAEQLKNHLKQSLPAYMIPTAIIFLEAMPLTANGKVDRRALPAPELRRSDTNSEFVAPTLPLHHQLVQIWEDLLGVHPIGLRDDFFELGGHSLLAIRLFDRIEQIYGKKLSASLFFTGATIEHLTNALMEDIQAQPDGPKPFIGLQVNGTRTPFFFLHGQTKEELALHCYPLARALGPDQPFYALSPYIMLNDLRRGHLPTLEEVAIAHIKTIRSIQPEGPYLLGGFCNGGTIAYAIARQLRAEGQQVDLLVSIDPDFLVYALPYRLYYAAFQFIGKLFRLHKVKQVYWALHLKHALRLLYYKLTRKEDPDPLTFTELHEDYTRLYDWVVLGYKPSTIYEGKITLFWAQEGEAAKTLRTGWREVEEKGNVEIHMIPGDHLTCKSEYLYALAEHLDDCIRRAQRSPSQTTGKK
jgi:amino acid adenylation domain-containing protein